MTRKKAEEKKSPDSTNEGKVFDVSKPGESLPSASGRPIIVTHKPGASDPMVSPAELNDEEKESEEPKTELGSPSSRKLRIEPLHTSEDRDQEADSNNKQDDSAVSSEATPKDDADYDEKKTEPKDEVAEASEEIADIAGEVTTKKDAQNEADKKEAEKVKKQAEIEAFIENKQFFVPINAVQKRRSLRMVIVCIVFIVLALVGVLALLDAELLDIGIVPPTDFL